MGQYKRSRLEYYNWLREKTNKLKTLEEIIQHVENPEQINLEKLEHKLGLPREILAKTIERLYGPKTQISHKLYHWWQEPDGSYRKIDPTYIKQKIRQKMKELGAKTVTELLKKKMKISHSEASLYYYWLKHKTAKVRTRTLKRFCKHFKISYEELEKLKIIKDRTFPINLHKKELVKLYTHILNEGSIRGQIPRVQATYVNKDPVLHRHVIDLVKAMGGEYKIPPPSKEAIETKIDSVTARILIAAGLPPSYKTITNPPLHPAILKNKKLAKYHLHMTFIEEGYSSLTINRHNKLELQIGFGRSKDITDLIPQNIYEKLTQKKGYSIQPTQIPDERLMEIITATETIPKALFQEYLLLTRMLNEINPKTEIPEIRCSYIHVSKEGRVTAYYRYAFRSSDSVHAFHELLFKNFDTGTWKERKLGVQIELLEEYEDKKLTASDKQRIQEILANWRKIPDNWIIEKIKQVLPDINWIDNPDYLKKILEK
nr:hypothetical protein [Candidatus Baldrarchaeota archaeon]